MDSSFYTGITNNLEKRINEHNDGIDKNSYTYNRRPVVLKWYEKFTNPTEAITFEKKIKGWSRKKKGTIIEITNAPVKPVNIRVIKGLSIEDSFLVLIT